MFVEVGQPDKARPLIGEAEQRLKSEKALATIATCCEMLGEPQKAEEYYQKAVKAFPQNSRILRASAAFNLRTGKEDAAEKLLRDIIALETPATLTDAWWARRLLAMVLKRRDDFKSLSEATQLIEENIRKLPSSRDKRLLADYLLADPRKEKINDAIKAMEEVLQNPDATPEDRFNLAQLYLRKSDMAAGEAEKKRCRDVYEEQMHAALQSPSAKPQYLVSYINALMDHNELEDADRWLQTLEQAARDPSDPKLTIHFAAKPDSFETMATRAEYLFRRAQRGQAQYQDVADAATSFASHLDAMAPDRCPQLRSVAVLMEDFANRLKAENKQTLAASFIAQADTFFNSPRSRKAWGGLEKALQDRLRGTRIELTVEQQAQIDKILEAQVRQSHLLYAAFLARQSRTGESLTVLERYWDSSDPDALQFPSLCIIGNRAATPDDIVRLEKLLVAAQKVNQSPGILMVLAGLNEQRRQYDKAIENYRQILAKQPRNFKALNNLAVDLVRSGKKTDIDEALGFVNQALKIRGPLAAVLDSRALVYIAQGDFDDSAYDKALKDVDAAIMDDGTAEQYFHKAWVLRKLDRRSEAAAAFKTALNKKLDPKELGAQEIAEYDRLKDSL